MLDVQRRKRGWTGSIVTNGNCSAITFTLAAAPLHRAFGIERVVVTTMQALSGAGYPGVASLDALDNVVPFIGEEEEKMEQETKKFLGSWDGKAFKDAEFPFSAHCNRVSVRDGHTVTVSVALRGKPARARRHAGDARLHGTPAGAGSAERAEAADRRARRARPPAADARPRWPATACPWSSVACARMPAMGTKFVVLGHNTIRGAAGASVLNAELLAAEGCLGA